MSAKADLVSNKRHNKKDLFKTLDPSSSKVILTLLTEVVALYVKLSVIYV